MAEAKTIEEIRKTQLDQAATTAARAAIGKAAQDLSGFVKCRVIRSVTTEVEGNAHRDYFIDVAIPVGVPITPGAGLLIHSDDVVTPIAHSFFDVAEAVQVITTQAVTFFAPMTLEQVHELYLSKGWTLSEPKPPAGDVIDAPHLDPNK